MEVIANQPTFLSVGESPPEGPAHADLAILQVLQGQVLNGDGLSIHLEAAPLATCRRPGQNQQLGEQEHVQPLEEHGKLFKMTQKACRHCNKEKKL